MRLANVDGTALAVPDDRQWVPIGPSISIDPQSARERRMPVTGRVRDLQIDPTGTRAYAGAAKGGVWYTGDEGRTWRPVGGWVRRIGTAGGPNSVLSVGSLLVDFGDNTSEDFVMVGTGETTPDGNRSDEAVDLGGVGVLAARAPANDRLDEDPWEAADGLAQLEGLGIYRLARRPSGTAGSDGDIVLAGTSAGLFRGTRSSGRFTWVKLSPTFNPEFGDSYQFINSSGGPGDPKVTDLLWLPVDGSANGRLYATLVARYEEGLDFVGPPTPVYSDDGGQTFHQATGSVLTPDADRMGRPYGRASLAAAGTGSTVSVYVMGGWHDKSFKTQVEICAIDNPFAASTASSPPTLRRLDVPRRTRRHWETRTDNRFWGEQGDYSQAFAASRIGTGASARDRLFLGGAGLYVNSLWMGSLWCFDVDGDDLVAAPGISESGGANRSFRPGHIGTGTHADVHAIRIASGDGRKVWVGNDGGVAVSVESGRDKTFVTRSDGIAALETQYGASHPTSSSFALFGCQDNGGIARTGDVVWDEVAGGDGGGVAFDIARPENVLIQTHNSYWVGKPGGWFATPAIWSRKKRPDHKNAQFYSNASVARMDPASDTTRIAIGTDRVWVIDQSGRARANRWRVLPGHNFVNGRVSLIRTSPVRRSRSVGNLPARGRRQLTFGILRINEGSGNRPDERSGVSSVRWVRNAAGAARALLVLIDDNVYRYDQVGDPADHRWRAHLVAAIWLDVGFDLPNHGRYLTTEIAPVHGTDQFYVTTTSESHDAVDTAYFYDGTTLRPTGLKDEITQRDPAYSVTVDDDTGEVYVGTALGVWHGVRDPADNTFDWELIGRRLPPAIIQDLHVHKASAEAPKTLVASLASRGMWQLNLDRSDHTETWIRSHAHDDRRTFPTPLANPRARSSADPLPVDQSPDIVVRPRWPRTDPPPAFPGRPLTRRNHTTYQIWTFQTAFRRFQPGIAVDGRWTRPFETAIQRFRDERSDLSAIARPTIDRQLWDLVVVDDPTAVYEPPWRPRLAIPMAANEADLRRVVPQRTGNGRWHVPGEQCTVEVLIHHRDTNFLGANQAFAALFWQWGDLASVRCDGIATFARGLDVDTGVPASSVAGWTAPTDSNPNGRFGDWHVAMTGPSVLHRLPVQLDARMPRAVPIDIDLGRNPGSSNPQDVAGPVVLLAVVGSTADRFSHSPPTIGQPDPFIRRWRHAAMRTVVCTGPR